MPVFTKRLSIYQIGLTLLTLVSLIYTMQAKPVLAQTILAPGNIVVIGIKADDPDDFSFVPLVDLEAGTEIVFTDSGWTGSAFRGSEGAKKYTAPTAITAGTVISLVANATDFTTANDTNVGTSGLSLSTSGDQIIAFQGASSSPTFIFAAQINSNQWQAGATNTQESALPTGLTNGVNAVAAGAGPGAGDEFDNAWYSGTTSGTAAEILAAVANNANWTGNDATYTPFTTNFTITGGSTGDAPTIEESATTTTFLDLTTTGPGVVSGVISDPTDPAATLGIDFTIGDTDTDMANLSVTAASSNQAVVADGNLNLTGSGANRNLKITPTGLGEATLTVTVTDPETNSATYTINYAASAASVVPATSRFHTGTSDASATIAIDSDYMVVGDDENQALRVYNRHDSGLPVAAFDFSANLGLSGVEVDIEGATRVGNRLYWIGSHSNNKSGNDSPDRERIFSTDLSGTGAATTLTFVNFYQFLEDDLIAWDNTNGHGLGAAFFGLAASAAAGVVPEQSNGFSIEGLSMAPGSSTTAYIAFRAPIVPTTARTKALIVPVTNFTTIVDSGAGSGSAAFGTPIQLNLAGRGIRSLECNANGCILIGGAADGGGNFALYTWSGNAGDAPELRAADSTALSTGGSFESFAELPAGNFMGANGDTLTLQLVTDNGDTVWYGNGTASKDLAETNQQKFRSDLLTLGAVTSDNMAPTISSLSPADNATGAAVGSNLVATFNENVQLASGTITLKKIDGSIVETFDVTTASQVTVSGAAVTIDPTADLEQNTGYYVEITAGAIQDLAGNGFAGIADNSTWNFATATPALHDLQVTEIWVGQDGADLTADWFEILNQGTQPWVAAADPTLYYDDDSADPTTADPIQGLTQIAPGARAIVVIGAAVDATTFSTVWSPDTDLTGVEIGYVDGAGLGSTGDAVTLWVGDPRVSGTLVDNEAVPTAPSGVSYDVELAAFSTVGNASGAVSTTATAGTSGTEPAIGSPGNNPYPAGTGGTVEATTNLTVQPNGPRTGSSGLAFLNIEGSSYNNFASWGPLEFDTTGITCGTGYEITSLQLTFTQSNAAFTTNGTVAFFVTQDTATSLAQSNTALTFNANALPYGLGTQLDPKTLLGVGTFTQVATGAQDVYELANLPGFFATESYLLNQINGNQPSRLIVAPNDATVAATWAGYTNSSYNGPTLAVTCSPNVIPNILINEVEADSPGTDVAEFVELYDGGVGNTALDGLTLVLYNGNGDVVYNAFDLDGKSTDANGYFVLCGNAANVTNCDLAVNVSQDLIQNGADAVALYQGDATAFLNGTAVTTANLVDALVYDTSDADDSGLLVLLNAGQPQVDENANGASGDESNQRCPNGAGGQRNTNTFGQYAPTPGAANTCPAAPPATTIKIYEIQGSGTASSYDAQTVNTSGIVVADFQGSNEMNGFFLQDPIGDGNPATSDGIFVYAPGGTDVNVGDIISITAQVDEFNSLTELKNVTSLTIQSSGNALPAPAQVTLPESTDGELEQYEGMYVQITDASNMFVAQNYFVGRYGQLTLSAGQRLYQPTNQELPGSGAAIVLAADNAKRFLLLDDGQDISALGDNPNPVPYLGSPPPAVLRAGDKVSNLIGVLDFGRINSAPEPDTGRDYRLQPTAAPVFTAQNLRQNAPDAVGGTLKVAAFNVLNYFNGNGSGGGFPTSRGADTASEFSRQRDKIIAALSAINGDVVGLLEIENDGYGTNSAIQDLVNGLNAALGAGTYAFINPGVSVIGTDEIAVALIYKPSTVTPMGAAAILDSSVDPNFIDTKNRPALAQTFQQNSNGEKFTVTVNHLKSKGSDCNDVSDPDTGDGQGNCNLTRTKAANALADWLATDPTGSNDPDFLIIGDLNSYAKEDPITALQSKGYTNLINQFIGINAYSYTFDGLLGYLDHALATASLTDKVTGVTEWHINTDEPEVINYDEDFNPAGYYAPTPYRASDHDPVIVGLNLAVQLNSSVTQLGATTSNNPTPQLCAATGTNLAIYTVTSTMQNSSANTFTDLYFRVKTLEYTANQGGQAPSLCNATTVVNNGGVGSILAIPNSSLFGGDNQLNPGENLVQAFAVGRPVTAQFRIKVDLYSSAAAAAGAPGGLADNGYLGSFEYVFDPMTEAFTPVQEIFLPLIVR